MRPEQEEGASGGQQSSPGPQPASASAEEAPPAAAATSGGLPEQRAAAPEPRPEQRRCLPGAWGFMQLPTQRDIAPKRRRLAFDLPVPDFAALVVMDFEWTADLGKKMMPCGEIIQLPAVIVRFDGKWAPSTVLPDRFDTFVRPRFNPVLSRFSKQLCAISQEDVDKAPDFSAALSSFLAWLRGLGLVTAAGEKDEAHGRWCFATWSDADIGGTLVAQLQAYQMELPPCFSDWVDLKQLFQRRYKHGPSGGLQRCVEYLGLKFEGRAHNGLVDAFNTARLAAHMARDGFVFRRATRGIDPRSGQMFGSRRGGLRT